MLQVERPDYVEFIMEKRTNTVSRSRGIRKKQNTNFKKTSTLMITNQSPSIVVMQLVLFIYLNAIRTALVMFVLCPQDLKPVHVHLSCGSL